MAVRRLTALFLVTSPLDDSTKLSLPLNQRKLVARRALFEMRKGAVGNVGVGIADGIGLVAREEGCADDFILTVENRSDWRNYFTGYRLWREREYPRHSGYDVPV
ncbi:putative CoA transferase [Escherichia coli]|uniref:Putative CoA transferase n=1 Tax=Escherichia coli TaxID=562 RepID=A0A485JFZ6_ECOLX|nr:putative CoA transferase [Escherichia coli]